MSALETQEAVQTLEVAREELIAAPIDVVFETILDQMGPNNETPDGTALPMKIEAWPGGRWFRDLGGNTGHVLSSVGGTGDQRFYRDYLDLAPKGRDEDALDMPMAWLRHHDRYEDSPKVSACGCPE